MAETNANIRVGVDTTDALSQLKNLQRQISMFHSAMASSGKAAAEQSARMQSSLMKSINATGAFTAQLTTIKTGTESFTNALEKNKLSMTQYFRYAGGATKSFGKLFTNEFNTIQRVAEERVKDLQTQYIKMGRDANGAMKAIKVRPATLDMQNYGTQVAIAAQKQALFNQLVKQGTTNLLNWGKNTQWAGRQLMVGFTVPLTIFGGIAIREFQKIEEQAIKFRRVYGDMFTSTKETEQALDNIRQLADEFTKYGIAVEKTIDLAAKVAQMGNMGAALEAQVTQATRLSVLGGIEQQDALDTTISLTNAFGVSIENLADEINFLNAAENQTILAIEDFNTAIPLAGSVVRQLGGDVQDLAVLLTAMREGGINASQAGNALKSSLARLIAPSRNAKETLGGFGIDVMAIVNQNAGNLMGTINTLAVALNNLDPLSRARSIEALFGKFQFARMSTLFQNIVDGGSQANKVLDLTANSAEELAILADRELGRVEESAATKFQKAVQQIQAALAPIGEAFLEVVVPVLNVIRDLVERFAGMGETGKRVFVALVAVMGVVAPAVLMVVGLVANGIANMLKFGQVVGNAFAKFTGSSKVLTEQTSYLNSEQIEMAAIAASLDQVHNDLIQTFNAEAVSLDLLSKAYQRAIDKQNMMLQGKAVGAPGAGPTRAGGTGGKVPGYANGIVSVPGPKGKGDIVPAMLSPGEAVIPTAMADKYAPLIAGIIADNIPGFQRGRFEQAHLTNKLDPSDPAVREQLEALYPGITESQMGNMEILSDLTMEMPSWMNQDLRPSAGGIAPERFKEASGGVKDKLLGSAQAAAKDVGLDVNEATLRGLSQGLEDDITNRAADLAQKAGTNVTDEVLSQATDEVLSEAKKAGGDRGKLAEGLEGRSKMVGGHRGKLEGPGTEDEQLRKLIKEGKAGVRKGPQGGAETYMLNPDGSLGPKIGRFADSGSRQAGKDFFAGQKANEQGVFVDEKGRPILPPQEARLRGTSLDRASVAGAPGFSKRKGIATVEDPTALARDKKVAADTAKKTAQAAKRKAAADEKSAKATEENAKATKENTKATKQKTEKTKKSTATPEKPAGRQLSDDPRNVRRRELAAERRRKQQLINEQKMRDYGTTGEITPEMRARRKAALARERQLRAEAEQLNRQANISRATEQQVKKQGMIARIQERMLQRKQARLAREQALATQETAVNSRVTPNKAAGVGMALSGGLMAASMAPGKIGELAQQLMMPMFALPAVLPMLQNKFGILLVAVGALVGGFMFLNDSFKKAAKESLELAMMLGSGSKAINEFAKTAGKVTAGEIMDRRRASAGDMFQVQPGKSTFGETFMEGDMGEEFLSSITQALDAGGMEAVQSQLVNQLGTAVASGALTAGQARSIVAEVSNEIGDYGFGIEVNSRLISLLGPDGENILESPLELRVRLVEESRERIRNLSAPINEEANRGALQAGGMTALKAGGGALAGLAAAQTRIGFSLISQIAIRAAGQAALGAAAGSIAPGVGNAIGAVIGTAAGVAFAVKDIKKAMDDVAIAGGAVVASGIMALQQQQELLDSLQIDYERRIASAQAAGDIAEATRLENQYMEDRLALLQQNAETMQVIRDSFNQAGFFARQGLQESLDQALAQMGGSPLEQMVIDSTTKAIDSAFGGFLGMGGNQELAYELKMILASGDVPPGEVLSLLENFKNDEQAIQRFVNIMTNLGTAEGARALQVMNMFSEPEQQVQFQINVEAMDTASASSYLNLFQEISKVGGVFNADVVMGFYLANPTAAQRLNNDLNRIREIAAEGPVGIEAYLTIFDDPEAQAALLEYADEFAQLDPVNQVTYIQTFRTIFDSQGTPGFQQELDLLRGEQGDQSLTGGDLASRAADRAVRAQQSLGGVDTGETEEDISGSGQKASSVLDDLLKRLRDVRKLQIDVTAGWVESSKKINELFGGGRTIDVFAGLEQQMRAVGAQEDLITMIAGMPPEEFERAKDQLFNFDEAGNIVSMTNNLRNMGEAFKAIALGDFHNEQQRVTRQINEQIVAMRKLTAAGLSAAQAYDVVQNAALASAIAHEKNRKVIKDLIRETKEAKEMTEAFAAAQAVARKNQEAANLRSAVNFAKANFGALTEAQKNLVLTDSDIQALIRTNVDPAQLREALKNAEEKAKLELEIKKLTFDGRVSIFEEGFNKAMEKFRVLETEVKLRFEAEKEPYVEAIKQAEREIADIRRRVGGLDELEADLQRISWQEKDINDAYDKRIEALDKIASAQDKINERAKSQLDIADALSRGDIAAAARAVQENRIKAAEAAMQDQRDRLEQARQLQLEQVRGNMGLTREVIEERILALQKEIFNIEQQRIVPNQRQVELLERTEAALIEGLTVLGKTRKEWEQIKNRVDIAKVSTDEFKQAMQNALDIVEDIVNYWNEFDESPKNIQINEKTVRIIEEIYEGDVEPAPITPGTGGTTETEQAPTYVDPFGPNFTGPRNQGEFSALDGPYIPPRQVRVPPLSGRSMGGFPSILPGLLGVPETTMTVRGDEPTSFTDPGLGKAFGETFSKFGDWLGGLFGGGNKTTSSMPAVPRTPDGKIDYSQIPEPKTAGFSGFGGGSGKPAMIAAPALNTSGLLASIGKAFTPQAVEKTVGPGIRQGVSKPIRETANKTPSLFQRFTNFFNKDVPKTTLPAINSSISKPLESTGKKAPTLLGSIGNFFTRTLPSAATPILSRVLPGQFSSMSTSANRGISTISSSISNIPRGSADAIERRLSGQFGTMSSAAVGEVGTVGSAITGLPGETSGAIEGEIPGQFSFAAGSARGSVGGILGSFISIAGYVSGSLVRSISSAFSAIRSIGRSAASSISSSFGSIGSSLVSSVRSGMNRVFDTLRGFRIPYTSIRPFSGLPRFNKGGLVPGMGSTDTIPAMLTPGEFVVRKFAVQEFGIDNLKAINEGNYANLKSESSSASAGPSGSVYNYNLSVNVKSDADANQIARTVIDQIKTIDSQRIRGNRF